MPRVLIIEEGGIGGVANYTNELATSLARLGLDVQVATARDHTYRPGPGVRMCPVFPYVRGRTRLGRLLRRTRLARPINGLGHLIAVLALLSDARRAWMVHLQGEEWPPLGAASALLLRLAGCGFVYTPHNTFDRGTRTYRRAHAVIRRCASRIIVHSQYDRQAIAPRHRSKAVVIPHGEYGAIARAGLSDRPLEVARAIVGASDDELVVLLFGQLRPDKGVRDLLQAAIEIDRVRVVLGGEDKGALAECAGLLSDARLHARVAVHQGFLTPLETGRLFAAADVVTLPYRRASASGVLLLAYGYERPVLIYPTGGLPEYVLEGETGWISERCDPVALAEQLRAIIEAGHPERRRRGERGRQFAQQRLGWNLIARRTREVYESVTGPADPPGSRGWGGQRRRRPTARATRGRRPPETDSG